MARYAVSLQIGLLLLAGLARNGLVAAERPNVVFLLTDDQRADTLGCMANSIIRTPHLDTSDHGFYLGEYGFAGKWYPHEVSIRVPLIIHDPRAPATARGIRRAQFALSIDVAPTILA